MAQLSFEFFRACSLCGAAKPLTEFYREKSARDGYRSDCKACFAARAKARYPEARDAAIARAKKWQEDNRDRHLENQRKRRQRPDVKLREREGHLRRKFGITLDEYGALLQAQRGVCAICGRLPREDSSLHVDHDHETGDVRGLLCFQCNNALGDFDDELERLRSAVGYLDRPEPEVVAATRIRLDELKAMAADR